MIEMALSEESTTSCSTMMSQRPTICRNTRKAGPIQCQLPQDEGGVPEKLALTTDRGKSVMVCWLWPTESSGTRKDLGEN